MFFSVITKNSNWETLPKNLVRGLMENQYIRGGLPKKGGLDSLLIQGRGLARKRERVVFEGREGIDTLMPTIMKGEREGLCLFA